MVLPDEAVQGTDTENMQIKEIGGQGRSSKWLAVHIPDNVTHFKPVKIISSENAAADLEKIVGPNRETLAKELQTIIGVDGKTLNKMITDALQNEKRKSKKTNKAEDDDEEENDNDKYEDENNDSDEAENNADDDDDDDEEEKEKQKDDDDDDNQDDINEDEDDENEDGSADDNQDCKTKDNNEDTTQHKAINSTTLGDLTSQAIALYEMKLKTCKGKKSKHGDKSVNNLRIPVGKEKNKVKYKNYKADSGKNKETPSMQDPPGMTLADYLNGVKAKRKKENKKDFGKLCNLLKFGALNIPSCNKHQHKQRHFHSHSRHSHHSFDLDKMFRKLLKTNTGQFDSKMYNALKQLTMDRVQTSKDGNVHVFPHHGPHRNTYEEALNELLEKDPLSRMYNDLPTSGSHMSSQLIKPTSQQFIKPASLQQSQLPSLTLDNTYNGPAIRVPDSFNHQETNKPFSPVMKGTGINPVTTPELPSPTASFHNEADNLANSDQILHNQILKQELSKSCFDL